MPTKSTNHPNNQYSQCICAGTYKDSSRSIPCRTCHVQFHQRCVGMVNSTVANQLYKCIRCKSKNTSMKYPKNPSIPLKAPRHIAQATPITLNQKRGRGRPKKSHGDTSATEFKPASSKPSKNAPIKAPIKAPMKPPRIPPARFTSFQPEDIEDDDICPVCDGDCTCKPSTPNPPPKYPNFTSKKAPRSAFAMTSPTRTSKHPRHVVALIEEEPIEKPVIPTLDDDFEGLFSDSDDSLPSDHQDSTDEASDTSNAPILENYQNYIFSSDEEFTSSSSSSSSSSEDEGGEVFGGSDEERELIDLMVYTWSDDSDIISESESESEGEQEQLIFIGNNTDSFDDATEECSDFGEIVFEAIDPIPMQSPLKQCVASGVEKEVQHKEVAQKPIIHKKPNKKNPKQNAAIQAAAASILRNCGYKHCDDENAYASLAAVNPFAAAAAMMAATNPTYFLALNEIRKREMEGKGKVDDVRLKNKLPFLETLKLNTTSSQPTSSEEEDEERLLFEVIHPEKLIIDTTVSPPPVTEPKKIPISAFKTRSRKSSYSQSYFEAATRVGSKASEICLTNAISPALAPLKRKSEAKSGKVTSSSREEERREELLSPLFSFHVEEVIDMEELLLPGGSFDEKIGGRGINRKKRKIKN